jgi:rhodanese-related sulfurtransferase
MAPPAQSIDPEELQRLIDRGEAPFILDVRSAREYRRGHLPGARHLPFWQLPWRTGELLPRDRETVLLCGHGPRAWLAGAALRRAGHRRIRTLRGHMRRWMRLGLPLER